MGAAASVGWGENDKPVVSGQGWGENDKPVQGAPSSMHEEANNAIKNFVGGVASQVSPINKLKSMVDTLHSLYNDPIGTIENFGTEILAHPYSAFARGIQAAKEGKPEEAAVHFSNALEPAGFLTEGSEVKTVTPGERARGFGELVGTGADAYLTGKLPDIATGIKNKAKAAISSIPEVSPETRDVIGIISPRAKNILGVSQKLRAAGQGAIPPPLPEAVPPPLPETDPILDKLAKGLGGKDFASLSPEGQATVQGLAEKLNGAPAPAAKAAPTNVAPIEWRTPEEIAKASAPAAQPAPQETLPAPTDIGLHGGVENTPTPAGPELTQRLQDLLRQVKTEAGFDPNQPLGQLKGGQYTARFDSGDPNSPIIDSTKRKPYSTAEVANPQLITKAAADKVGSKLAGVVSPEQFDKMVKNPKVREIISNLAGQEADPKLLSAIRRRIAKNPGQAPTGYTISDLMKDIK